MAILGALRGIWGGLALLFLAALFPGLAWLVATHAEGLFGMGFIAIFLAMLALEVFLAVCALFGIASEVQDGHSAAIDQAAGTPDSR